MKHFKDFRGRRRVRPSWSRRTSSWMVGVALGGLSLLGSSTAWADATYDAPASCPSRDDFRERLEKSSARAEDVDVSVRATDAGFAGEISRNSVVVRRVEGSTCEAVVDALVLSVTLGASDAPSTESAAPPKKVHVQEEPPPVSAPPRREQANAPPSKRYAIELNPLALTIGRYSITGEWMVANHHAVVATGYAVYAPRSSPALSFSGTSPSVSDVLRGFGTEIGYRYYWSDGIVGPYIGVSALVGAYSRLYKYSDSAGRSARLEASSASIGGAVDIGGQITIGPGILLGGGLGLQYTTARAVVQMNPTDKFGSPKAGASVRGLCPRLLFTVGYAF